MKFSHAWLSEYVDFAESPERAGRRLTSAGLALDGLEAHGDDVVYDFEIFPNRPDCMNHVGLAREYAALTGAALRLPPHRPPRGGGRATGDRAAVVIEAPDLCARYAARAVGDVRVGASPDWLRRRLESIGLRPINNLVDITNFVLWELGHPLHVFDLERLEGARIVVRRARAGERLVTLDGIERVLDPDMLVIADARRPVALAGIIGGEETGVTASTRQVLIESAWFEPIPVRRTARALGLRTDASHRFERGADPAIPVVALDRAAALMAELAGGTVSDPALDVHPRPEPGRRVPFRPARAASLLGVPLAEERIRQALERRAFLIKAAGPDWTVEVPSFRRDVEREADLIEEVARHGGYDAIPSALPLLPSVPDGRGPAERRVAAFRRALLAAGLYEAINYAMVGHEDGVLFGCPDPAALDNPLQSQASHLRPSLIPGLLMNLAHNLNHGAPSCLLFEIGTVFLRGKDRPEERTRAGFVLSGRGLPAHWSAPRRDVDLYDARGVVESAAALLGFAPVTFASDRIPWFEDGQSLRASRDGVALGSLGSIAPTILARYGIERPAFAGEIDLDALDRLAAAVRRYVPLPRFPAIRRDLALVLRREVTYEAVIGVIRGAARLPLADIQVFDRYAGPGVPEACVSLAVQLVFQHPERTLTHDEVQAAQDAIVEALKRDLEATLRGLGPLPGGR